MPGVSILNSDKTAFTSYNFGNIVAGASSANKLLFVSSTGSGTASGVEFGIEQVSANDGYSFCEVDRAEGFTSDAAGVSGSATIGGGSISGASSGNMKYAVSVVDAWSYESTINSASAYAPSMTSGTNTYAVMVAWDAVSGASQYGLYLSLDAGTSYKKVTTTANAYYTDTTGTATATDPQAAASTAFRPSGTWVSGTSVISLSDMTSGSVLGVFMKEVVASGTTSAANPRQHYIYALYVS